MGGGGADVLGGGAGNDTFVVDHENDGTFENPDGGMDTVLASTSFFLFANVENLILTGSALNGSGNGLDNRIIRNGQANELHGGGGADRLEGGGGDDLLCGVPWLGSVLWRRGRRLAGRKICCSPNARWLG